MPTFEISVEKNDLFTSYSTTAYDKTVWTNQYIKNL
jgi:hypothetical protein